MQTLNRIVLALAVSLFVSVAAQAAGDSHDHTGGKHHDSPMMGGETSSSGDHAGWMAAAKEAYPLQTCVVSGDNLEGGDMGGPVDYVYKQDGKPDRLVRFCCKSCVKDFKKDPAKYLAAIDAAVAKKGAEKPADAHSGHSH